MAFKLKVPYVTQKDIGGHVAGAKTWTDWTGCWYASACMVAYFFGAGPRLGVPALFSQWDAGGLGGAGHKYHEAMAHTQYKTFAKNEHLESVPNCESPTHDFTLAEIEALLRTKGPILFSWYKEVHGSSSYGHVSCITGVDASKVFYHDPEVDTTGAGSTFTIAGFNHARLLYKGWAYTMMQRAGLTDLDVARIRSKSTDSVASRIGLFGG